MPFEFICWCCGATCVVEGKARGFWSTTHYEVVAVWSCWSCGSENTTPDDDED
ncbi:hypothetical protein ACWEBX_03340 [Streptomyces sp. NPDC005070]